MISTREAAHALFGAWRLAHLDRSGFLFFDSTREGFWNSFAAAVLVYPFFLLMLVLSIPETEWQEVDVFRLLLVETIGYVVRWVTYPLLIFEIANASGRSHRFFGYIVAYNWAQVLEVAVFIAVLALSESGILPSPVGGFVFFAAIVLALAYEAFIAKEGLGVPVFAALVIVALNLLLSFAVTQIGQSLH